MLLDAGLVFNALRMLTGDMMNIETIIVHCLDVRVIIFNESMMIVFSVLKDFYLATS